MPSLSALLNTMAPSGEGYAIEATPDWLQGRTLYGGMSAGFCLEAARLRFTDLPLLRTAHFTFAGPASGRLLVVPSLLRRGKSVAVVGVDVVAETGLAVRAVLTFGTARESELSYLALPMPRCATPTECESLFDDAGPRPDFFGHFDVLSAGRHRPLSGAAVPEFLLWVRHRGPGEVDPLVALLALADAPPPAAFAMFPRRAPISTVNWAVNIMGLPGSGAWHLISTRADSVLDGYSSQQMVVWGEDGRALVSAQQNVAVFL